MNSPLARYLRDFGAETVTPVVQFDMPLHVEIASDFPALEAFVEPIDIEAERRQAYDEGHRAATESLAAEHEDALAELQQKHAAELDVHRGQIEESMAEHLAKALAELSDRITSDVVEGAVRLVLPLLKQELERKAVDDLAAQLKPELAKEIMQQIKVSGPEHLCELLRAKLEEAGDNLDFTHTETVDLQIEIGDSLTVTRLSVFAADLEKVLA